MNHSKSVCICYTGNKDRYERLCEETNRVGVCTPEPFWCHPGPFNKVLSRNLKKTSFFNRDRTGGYFNCTMAHYSVIKTAYELGCECVSIYEDDCRFLKDASKVHEIISSVPKDFDIALLDHFRAGAQNKTTYLSDMERDRVNENWTLMQSARSTACYILKRSGMERLIYLYESCVNVNGGKLRLSDQWFDQRFTKGLNCYKAFPNAAIQCDTPTNNSGNDRVWSRYEGMGLNQEDYTRY